MLINVFILLYSLIYVYGSFYVKLSAPDYSEVGKRTTFQCYTSLNPKQIDGVHWYKDDSRFYRFKSGSDRPKQIYDLEDVNVDLEYSNLTHVTFLTNVRSEGLYACEVISKGLAYTSRISTAKFKVFYIPSKPISIQRNSYGNLLTCITKPTYPRINLTWFVNGEKASKEDVSKLREETLYNGTKIARIDLRIRPKTNIKYECRGEMSINLRNEQVTIGHFKTSLMFDGDYFPEIINERLGYHHNYDHNDISNKNYHERSDKERITKNDCIKLSSFSIVPFLLINKYLS